MTDLFERGPTDEPGLRFYASGLPWHLPGPRGTLSDLLDGAARRYGRRAALSAAGSRTGFRDLRRAAARVAPALTRLGLRRGDHVALLLPPSGVRGIVVGTAALLAGVHHVPAPGGDPPGALRAARRHAPTVLVATPADLRRLLRRPAHEHEALATVRTVVTAPLDPSTGERLRAPLDARVVETYGPAAAGVALANPLTADARPGTAGPALPGTRARIAVEGFPEVDVLPGHAGELLLRGPRIGDLAGLRGRPAGDGWLRTGRLAVRGPDGSVTLLDDGDGRGGAAPRHRRRRPAGRGRRPGAAPRRGRRGRRCAAPPRRPAGPVLSPG